jgi:hypothetical protein
MDVKVWCQKCFRAEKPKVTYIENGVTRYYLKCGNMVEVK